MLGYAHHYQHRAFEAQREKEERAPLASVVCTKYGDRAVVRKRLEWFLDIVYVIGNQ
jgi:hypothetical protein